MDKLLEIFEQIGKKLHKIKLMAVYRLSQRRKSTLANIVGRSVKKPNPQKGGNKGSEQNMSFLSTYIFFYSELPFLHKLDEMLKMFSM